MSEERGPRERRSGGENSPEAGPEPTRPVREERPMVEDTKVVEQRQKAEAVVPRDSARWGAIWAGLIATLATFVLLELLAFGIGILGTVAESPGAGGLSAWVTAIIGIIAFFTGGSVAGMTSAVRGAAPGIVNGILVWGLAVVLIVLLSSLGVGQLFGALGNVVGQFGAISQLTGAGGSLNVPEGGLNLPQGVSPSEYVNAIRGVAFGAFVSLLVAALVSALGGFLGGRTDKPIGRVPDSGDQRG